MEKIMRLPRHKSPILHENAAVMSFENCYTLAKVYKEIIGLNNVHHFSLNVVDHEGKMNSVFFSVRATQMTNKTTELALAL